MRYLVSLAACAAVLAPSAAWAEDPCSRTPADLLPGFGVTTFCSAPAAAGDFVSFDASSSDFAQAPAVKTTAAARATTPGRAKRRGR